MRPSGDNPAPVRPRLTPVEFADRAAALPAGGRLAVIGLGRDGVGEALAAGEIERGVLLVAGEDPRSARAVIDRLLDDLAELALAR